MSDLTTLSTAFGLTVPPRVLQFLEQQAAAAERSMQAEVIDQLRGARWSLANEYDPAGDVAIEPLPIPGWAIALAAQSVARQTAEGFKSVTNRQIAAAIRTVLIWNCDFELDHRRQDGS